MKGRSGRYENPVGVVRMTGFLVAAAGLLWGFAACVVASEPAHEVDGAYGDDETYYPEAPPPPRAEVEIGVPPGPNYVWVGGYWTRHHDNWHWVSGRWAARPHANAAWEAGHWDHDRRGYVWRHGRWK